MSMGVPDDVEYLLGSDKRIRILEALGEGPKRQATVARECSIAPSTVHRNVEGLESRGWVREREDDEGYALTAVGERILAAYRSFADTTEHLAEYEPLLGCFEDLAVSPPTSGVVGGEVVTATPSNPHAAMVAAADAIRESGAERLRTVCGGVSPITNGAAENMLGEGHRIEIVTDRETMACSRESYFENYAQSLASDRVDLLVTDEPIRFGLVLADESVCVVGRENGRPRAALVGAGEDLRAWAEDVYRSLRERAGRVRVRYPAPDRIEAARERSVPRRGPATPRESTTR